MKINSYLKKCLQCLTCTQLKSHHLVYIIGNEAADADSIISSITYSYLCNLKNRMHKFDFDMNSSTPTTAPLYIPLVSITTDELKIRPDVMLLLQKFDIDYKDIISIDRIVELTSNLTFVQDAPLDTVIDAKIILVDHNSLSATVSSKFAQYISNINSGSTLIENTVENRNKLIKIIEILDHHMDLLAYTDELPVSSPQRNIAYDKEIKKETVGSCCTLIAEAYLSFMDDNILDGVEFSSTQNTSLCEILELLLGVILLDTCNMSVQANRGSQRDQNAISRLVTDVYNGGVSIDNESEKFQNLTNSYFQLLSDAKTDLKFWYGLTISECLNLDYKSFNTENNQHLSISSMVMPISMLFLKPVPKDQAYDESWKVIPKYILKQEFLHEIVSRIKQSNSCGYAINTFYKLNTEFQRELLIILPVGHILGMKGFAMCKDVCYALPLDSKSNELIKARFIEWFCQVDSTKNFEFSSISIVMESLPTESNSDMDCSNDYIVCLFKQNNVKYSRKQIAPMLQSIL